MLWFRASGLTAGLLCLAVSGCGGSDRSELAEVSGTVTVGGKPLETGTIIFEAAGSRPAVGTIEAGKITKVTTYEEGDGAPVGSHKVMVQSVESVGMGGNDGSPSDFNKDPATMMRTRSLIPQRYGDPGQSGLTAEIKSGENEVSFDLKGE